MVAQAIGRIASIYIANVSLAIHHVIRIAYEVFRRWPQEGADGNMDRGIEFAAQCIGLKD